MNTIVVQANLNRRLRKVLEPPNCSVCLEAMTKDLGVFTACGHVFHHQCAVNANQQSRKCPNCRQRSCEVIMIHYVIEEIDGVQQQMQEMLNSLSNADQFWMAELLQKYEDAVTEMHKSQYYQKQNQQRQKQKHSEELYQKADSESKAYKSKEQSLQEQMKLLTERKEYYKINSMALEATNCSLKQETEQQFIEIRNLKTRTNEYQHLDKLKGIIEQKDEEPHLKQIRMMPVQLMLREAQEIFDLYKLKSSLVKGIEQELEVLQSELELAKKKYNKFKSSCEDLSKENQHLKEYVKNRKQVPSQEGSINQADNYMHKKNTLDQDVKNIMDPYSYLKKRKVQEISTGVKQAPNFGKNTLLNQQGFHNPLNQQGLSNHQQGLSNPQNAFKFKNP